MPTLYRIIALLYVLCALDSNLIRLGTLCIDDTLCANLIHLNTFMCTLNIFYVQMIGSDTSDIQVSSADFNLVSRK